MKRASGRIAAVSILLTGFGVGCADAGALRQMLERTQAALDGVREAQDERDQTDRALATASALLKAVEKNPDGSASQTAGDKR
jgi:hypothetical protein